MNKAIMIIHYNTACTRATKNYYLIGWRSNMGG